MKKIVIYTLAAIGAVAVLSALVLAMVPVNEYRVYDCTTADWHPDVPNEVREHCRNLKLNTPRGITA